MPVDNAIKPSPHWLGLSYFIAKGAFLFTISESDFVGSVQPIKINPQQSYTK